MCSNSWSVYFERTFGMKLWSNKIEKDEKLLERFSFKLYRSVARAITLQSLLKRLVALGSSLEGENREITQQTILKEHLYSMMMLFCLVEQQHRQQTSDSANSLHFLVEKEKFSQVFHQEAIKLQLHQDFFFKFNRIRLLFHQLHQQATELAQKPYDSASKEHEMMLMQLWSNLKPEKQLEARVCEDWKLLGFQGRDPATDFRGMGILGLKQLLCYCSTLEGKQMFSQLTKDSNLPFAIAGINITNSIMAMRKPVLFKQFLLVEESLQADFFQILYSKIFGLFFNRWNESPKNYMEFNQILSQALESL